MESIYTKLQALPGRKKISVLGLILSFPPYLRAAMVEFPFIRRSKFSPRLCWLGQGAQYAWHIYYRDGWTNKISLCCSCGFSLLIISSSDHRLVISHAGTTTSTDHCFDSRWSLTVIIIYLVYARFAVYLPMCMYRGRLHIISATKGGGWFYYWLLADKGGGRGLDPPYFWLT